MRLEKAVIAAMWLFGSFVLWSPWTGGTWGQPYRGPDIRYVDYGFLGYYMVTIEDGRRTGRIQRGGLSATVVATALWSLLLLHGYRRCLQREQHARRASPAVDVIGHGDSYQPRPPSQQVSTME